MSPQHFRALNQHQRNMSFFPRKEKTEILVVLERKSDRTPQTHDFRVLPDDAITRVGENNVRDFDIVDFFQRERKKRENIPPVYTNCDPHCNLSPGFFPRIVIQTGSLPRLILVPL